MYSRWSQHFSVLSVPHAGSCLTQEFWCSYQQDKQIFPSATWACRRNKKEGGRETVRSMFSRNSCLSWDLKLLTFFSVATGEWCSTAAARSESVSWPSEQSLSESRACALDILKLLFNREKQWWNQVIVLHWRGVLELTVGSGPDGDTCRLSGPLLSESAHRESVLVVLLQTIDGHRLPLRLCHRHVKQIWTCTRWMPCVIRMQECLKTSVWNWKWKWKWNIIMWNSGSFPSHATWPSGVSGATSCTVTRYPVMNAGWAGSSTS